MFSFLSFSAFHCMQEINLTCFVRFWLCDESLSMSQRLLACLHTYIVSMCLRLWDSGWSLIVVLLDNWFLIANASDSRWGIPSIFRGSDNRPATKENFLNKPFSEAVEDMSQNLSMIYLKEVRLLCRLRLFILAIHVYLFNSYCLLCFPEAPCCLEAIRNPFRTGSSRDSDNKAVTKIILRHCKEEYWGLGTKSNHAFPGKYLIRPPSFLQ